MKKSGFTLVEIMIVVAIIALLTAIAIPAFLRYRQDSKHDLCLSNLRVVKHAKEIVAMRDNYTNATPMNATIITRCCNYIEGGGTLYCPSGPTNDAASYYTNTFQAMGTVPTCPVFPAGSTGVPEPHVLEK